MKRLLILTSLATMTAGLTGCRCCDWLWRGASATPAVPATSVMMADPCNPCDPCNAAAPMAGACSPAAVPAPGGYMGAPGS